MVAKLLHYELVHKAMVLFAQQETTSKTLPEPVRQVAYMALLGIVLLGMLLIVATLLGGHWVRRLGNRIRRPAVPPDVILPKQTIKKKTPQLPDSNPSDKPNDGDTFGVDETIVS